MWYWLINDQSPDRAEFWQEFWKDKLNEEPVVNFSGIFDRLGGLAEAFENSIAEIRNSYWSILPLEKELQLDFLKSNFNPDAYKPTSKKTRPEKPKPISKTVISKLPIFFLDPEEGDKYTCKSGEKYLYSSKLGWLKI